MASNRSAAAPNADVPGGLDPAAPAAAKLFATQLGWPSTGDTDGDEWQPCADGGSLELRRSCEIDSLSRWPLLEASRGERRPPPAAQEDGGRGHVLLLGSSSPCCRGGVCERLLARKFHWWTAAPVATMRRDPLRCSTKSALLLSKAWSSMVAWASPLSAASPNLTNPSMGDVERTFLAARIGGVECA